MCDSEINVVKKSVLKYRDTSVVNNSCIFGVGPVVDMNAAMASMLGEIVDRLNTE